MSGSTPPRKRRFPLRKADQGPSDGPQHGARDDERGSSGTGASLESAARGDHPDPAEQTGPTAPTGVPPAGPEPSGRGRAGAVRDKARLVARRGRGHAKAALGHLADRIIDIAPRIPVRDLATLRRQFPGLGPEEIADKLSAGAANATSTVGAGVGAAAMLPVPPAMAAELAAEITGVAAIELKLIAELYEVYGVRPPGGLKERSTAYLSSWSGERGIDVLKPSTINTALGGQMKRELRQQIMKRSMRNMPNLMPFMIGAAVGAAMNRRDTKKLAGRIRSDLRKIQVPWDALAGLPPLEPPAEPLRPGDIFPAAHEDHAGSEGRHEERDNPEL
ncbi:hypothetical protein [Streptomyces sp. V3I7]|uniref:hypothetical protein n=1 Tax=Streptomyces sp. V3I7 TaxID=3042278 RepID=UPI00277E8F29|nr:hypothetical protein [Streptomyces sp. V3I7]MDQ0993527.1 hypothetical protein [Streptomyces sp. V3I7]